MEPRRVLVVDDEANITDLVATALRYEGYQVATAASGQEALRAADEFGPDLVVLDLMLGDIDGFAVAERLAQRRGSVPVLFLSARDTVEDKVRGLRLGADDYLTKPFSLAELVARVEAVLRRRDRGPAQESTLRFADLTLDDALHEVRRGGQLVELTLTEYNLLRHLLVNAPRVLTRQQLLEHVWGYDFNGDARVLETYVSYLRRKLDPLGPPLIHTVRGVGYALRAPQE